MRARLLQIAWWTGLYRPPDRVVLEDSILPQCAAAGGPVLFVGVRFYTRHYVKRCPGVEFVTLDRDPAMRRYGAPHHVVAACEDLAAHFPPHAFQHVVVNGVFGWGIDSAASASRALAACNAVLRPGGILVIGVNEERPQTPDLSRLPEMTRFRPWCFPGLNRDSITVATPFAERSHTYRFFVRD